MSRNIEAWASKRIESKISRDYVSEVLQGVEDLIIEEMAGYYTLGGVDLNQEREPGESDWVSKMATISGYLGGGATSFTRYFEADDIFPHDRVKIMLDILGKCEFWDRSATLPIRIRDYLEERGFWVREYVRISGNDGPMVVLDYETDR